MPCEVNSIDLAVGDKVVYPINPATARDLLTPIVKAFDCRFVARMCVYGPGSRS